MWIEGEPWLDAVEERVQEHPLRRGLGDQPLRSSALRRRSRLSGGRAALQRRVSEGKMIRGFSPTTWAGSVMNTASVDLRLRSQMQVQTLPGPLKFHKSRTKILCRGLTRIFTDISRAGRESHRSPMKKNRDGADKPKTQDLTPWLYVGAKG